MNEPRSGGRIIAGTGSPVHTSHSLPEETRAILRAHRLRPRQSLGQNFLIDREALDSIVRAAGLDDGSQVLEIGPGIGTLTLALAATGATVHAVELDPEMARICRVRTAGLPNVTVHEANILHTDPALFLDPARPFKVVANIPYYITEPILRTFLDGARRPQAMVLMLQKEVAQRLAAGPGRMSRIAVFAQVQAAVEIVRLVPASSFLPPPEVDSAVVRLSLRAMPLVPAEEQGYLFAVVKAGFGSKRKMIHNALNHGLPNSGATIEEALATVGIDRERRAETLAIHEWRALCAALRADVTNLPRRYRTELAAGLDSAVSPDGDR